MKFRELFIPQMKENTEFKWNYCRKKYYSIFWLNICVIETCFSEVLYLKSLNFRKQSMLRMCQIINQLVFLHMISKYVSLNENLLPLMSTKSLWSIISCDQWILMIYARDIGFALEVWLLVTQATEQISNIGPHY